MRIMLLNANLAGVGTYHRALWFARMLAERGHECLVCTVSRNLALGRRTYADRPGVTVTEGPNLGFGWYPGRGSNFLDMLWRRSQLKGGGFDAVYSFEYHPNVSWPVAAALDGRPHVNDWCDLYAGAANVFHGLKFMHRWDARREAAIRRQADRVTVISDFLGERARGLGVPAERVTLIREGVDTDYMRPFDRAESRRRLGIPEDQLLVTTLQDGAAFPPLLESVAALHRENPRVRLLFVGRMKEAQKRLVAAAGLGEAVYCTGFCSDSDLPRFLSAGDVAGLPMVDSLANRSRFPHKIGDYLACGLPVAVTAVGEYPELLRSAGLGAVSAPGAAFTAALGDLLKDPERRRETGEKGRQWVRENLDWQVLKETIGKCVEG